MYSLIDRFDALVCTTAPDTQLGRGQWRADIQNVPEPNAAVCDGKARLQGSLRDKMPNDRLYKSSLPIMLGCPAKRSALVLAIHSMAGSGEVGSALWNHVMSRCAGNAESRKITTGVRPHCEVW